MKLRFPSKIASLIKPEKQVFLGVFLFGLVLQVVARNAGIGDSDRHMWANQIKFFLNHDPRVFDFHLAYGHPGTTFLGLGCLFHTYLGLPYVTALNLGISILIAFATAASSVLCFLLYRNC